MGITRDHPLYFVKKSKGVLHVGANTGQEAWIYAALGAPVRWFEPIPDVFSRLETNISRHKDQIAFQELLSDTDGKTFQFNIANNDGESSSIFDLDAHKLMYPEVQFTRRMAITSTTLDRSIERHQIPTSFDTLIMDTQGSELLVLKGATLSLQNIRWIFLECSDFSAYKGGCTCSELAEFISQWGFREVKRHLKKKTNDVGSYHDILFEKARE